MYKKRCLFYRCATVVLTNAYLKVVYNSSFHNIIKAIGDLGKMNCLLIKKSFERNVNLNSINYTINKIKNSLIIIYKSFVRDQQGHRRKLICSILISLKVRKAVYSSL